MNSISSFFSLASHSVPLVSGESPLQMDRLNRTGYANNTFDGSEQRSFLLLGRVKGSVHILGRIDPKRTQFYLKNKLAVPINFLLEGCTGGVVLDSLLDFHPEGSFNAVLLTFTPRGSGRSLCDNFDYWIEEKQSKCVVCAGTTELTLHHIIPHRYRRFLPPAFKNNNSHDVVALCKACHETAELAAAKALPGIEAPLTQVLKDLPFPRTVYKCHHVLHPRDLANEKAAKLVRLASTPIWDGIPDERKAQIVQTVLSSDFGRDLSPNPASWLPSPAPLTAVPYELLPPEGWECVVCLIDPQNAAARVFEARKRLLLTAVRAGAGEEAWRAAALKMLGEVDENQNLEEEFSSEEIDDAEAGARYQEFAEKWRHLFLDSMQPQHMPKMWKVDDPAINVN